MLLEVAGEEGLVGEPQFEGDFLHGLVCRAEQHLDFLDATGVDVLFGRVPRQVLDDGGEVARGDAELVGIELYVAMGAAMLEAGSYWWHCGGGIAPLSCRKYPSGSFAGSS